MTLMSALRRRYDPENFFTSAVAMPELADEVHRRHGLIDQLQHGVDIHF